MASKKKTKKKKSVALGIIKVFLLIIAAVVCIAGAVALGVFYGAKDSSPEINESNVLPTTYPSTIVDINGNEMIQLSSAGARRTEATSEEIPEMLKWAFVDLEDERFYSHNGIDLRGMVRAAYVTLTSDRNEGASTITQQLIKNNVFETGGWERSMGSTVRRKLQEWSLAMQLEKQMTKDEIITNYLNTINLGAGNYGVKEAARYYFGKELQALTLSECAVIASITQNPSANNPARYPENNWTRASKCLEGMKKNGHITQEEYNAAMSDNVYARIVAVANRNAGDVIYSYYIDATIEQVLNDLQEYLGYTYAQAYNTLYTSGVTVYSNENPVAQDIIDAGINNDDYYENIYSTYSIAWNMSVKRADGTAEYFNQLTMMNYFKGANGNEWTLDFNDPDEANYWVEEYKSRILGEGDENVYESIYYIRQPQASFTLMDYTTGQVLAICGGRGPKETSMSLNRATNTTRQPGSTFKIVSAFAPAIDMGVCTLATAFDDEPYKYVDLDKSIANWWGDDYRGLSTIRLGIRDSMNIVACKCLLAMGASNCLPYLRSFGYEHIHESDAVMSTAIGGLTEGVTNLENCAAFSAIANDGVYRRPMFYSKIVSRDGAVILDANEIQDVHQVISVETASLMTNAMRDVVTEGTGKLCDINAAPLAGKTGTTNDYRDLWFVGYVPNGLCSCIWLGYDENLSIESNKDAQKRFYGWIMNDLCYALGRDGGEFQLKGNIVSQDVCSKSGLLSNGLCEGDPEGSAIYTELFNAAFVPQAQCNVHTSVTVCSETGALATQFCPSTTGRICRNRVDMADGLGGTTGIHTGSTPDSPYATPGYCTVHTEEQTTTAETTASAEEPTAAPPEPETEAPAPPEPEPPEPEV